MRLIGVINTSTLQKSVVMGIEPGAEAALLRDMEEHYWYLPEGGRAHPHPVLLHDFGLDYRALRKSYNKFLRRKGRKGIGIVNGQLECGWYRTYKYSLECKACSGTGGNEEISGGHKKQCDECLGSGLDPVLFERFEQAPTDQRSLYRYVGPWYYQI